MTLKKCSVLFVFFVMTFNAVMLQAPLCSVDRQKQVIGSDQWQLK